MRAQRFEWTTQGMPDFGMPMAPGAMLTEPSGSPSLNPADEAMPALAAVLAPRPRLAAPTAAAGNPSAASKTAHASEAEQSRLRLCSVERTPSGARCTRASRFAHGRQNSGLLIAAPLLEGPS